MDVASLPTPQQQADALREALDQPLVAGRAWYVLSLKWWNVWAEYVKWDGIQLPSGVDGDDASKPDVVKTDTNDQHNGASPPPIDNTQLTLDLTAAAPDDGGPLKRGLEEQRDFILVPEDAWTSLSTWYGGGPTLKRSVIALGSTQLQIELYPLRFHVYKADAAGEVELSSVVALTLSRKGKVKELLDGVLRAFSVPANKAAAGDIRIWFKADSGAQQMQSFEVDGWELVNTDVEILEDVGISMGAALLLEQKVTPARGASSSSEWPFWSRLRQVKRAQMFKDPRNREGPPLEVGDEIDATEHDGAQQPKKWYPASVVDADDDRVLVQFKHRKPPLRKMPEVTKETSGWITSTVELTTETLDALRKVFEYYAGMDTNKAHMDKKAVASLISCASNTICQQEDWRVSNIFWSYDDDKDGLLNVENFLNYWKSRVSGTPALKEELNRLYWRAKIDFGAMTEEEELLQECKEWIPRNSERLAPAKTHVREYPYLVSDEREFRDFRASDRLDLQVGKEWHAAKVVQVDWVNYAVQIERLSSSGGISASSWTFRSLASCSPTPTPGAREWLPIESDRLARFQSQSASGMTEPNPNEPTVVVGVCEVPGACGLNNLGNTCFMNSVLQALSNTVSLRKYMCSGAYVREICKSPLSMGGRLATAFQELLTSLWADVHKNTSPVKLKALIGEQRPEFQGYQQHDAQELLTFLLDGLHEDLNRVGYPRPIVEDPESEGKEDRWIAEEAWKGHLRRNNSKIVELFQFQIRSEVTFPDVQAGLKQLKFDPMMYLQLPVPKPPHAVQVTVMPLDYPESPPIKCSVRIDKNRSFADMEVAVLSELKRRKPDPEGANAKRCCILADIYDNRLYRFYQPEQKVAAIRTNDDVWAFEVALAPSLPEERQQFGTVQMRKRAKPAYMTYGGSSSSTYKRFAPPQIFVYQAGVTTNADIHEQLQPLADRMRKHLGVGALEVTLNVASVSGSEEGAPLPDDSGIFQLGKEHTLSMNFIDLHTFERNQNPLPEATALDNGDSEAGAVDVHLEQCLDGFQQCEELAQDDWVFCSKTKEFEKSTKKLEIWTAPQILVIHLKRFWRESLTGPFEKIETHVRCPTSLDLTPWVAGPKEGKIRYSLYASVNHSGSLAFGHYTAHARVGDGPERHWFHFNDAAVSRAEQDHVVSKSSYILFYERVRDGVDA